MSTVAFTQHSSIGLFGHSGNSSMDEMRGIIDKESDRFALPVTFQKTKDSINSIIDVFRKRCEPNWDGYDAEPVSIEACKEAAKFLQKLPSTIPLPEIIAEPDGDIGLEWHVNNRNLFVIGFAGKEILSYSGLFGKGSKASGTEYFTDSIPHVIIENIRRVLAHH
ncbi:MAG: hypothetical protein O2999_03955 [Nitrospirae bacterium]|nr:hypothetical protein [Nitrospirota bacterium]MDA1303442.1 hypothetical protein [Nitrospirota bacterium]